MTWPAALLAPGRHVAIYTLAFVPALAPALRIAVDQSFYLVRLLGGALVAAG